MNRLACAVCAFLAAAASAMQPSPACAADEDTQLWLNAAASTALDEATTLTADVSERLREGDDQFLARLSIDRKLSDTIAIGAGYAFVTAGSAQEHRPHQQIAATFDNLSLRVRLEERFFEDADRPAFRLRSRLQYALPIAEKTKAIASAEWLYNLQQSTRGSDARTDQWRFIAGLEQSLSKSLRVTGSYMAIYTPRPGATDRLSHVPTVGIAYKF